MSNSTPEELAAEAIKPGKFSIVSAIKGRDYPTETVKVFLNESVAYKASIVKAKIKAIEDEISKERDDLQVALDILVVELNKSSVSFTIVGISEGSRQGMLNRSIENFPIEKKRDLNPLTGEFIETEIDNPKRDIDFTDALWQSHITKIESANGDVQNVITNNDVVSMRTGLPIAAVGQITETIEKIRVASAVFMMETNEDFLAKS
jgi:hypothetical protein